MAKRFRLKRQQLAAELAKRRYTQNRWAHVLGLGRGHLSLLLNGKRPYPSADTRRKLLEGLSVPFSTLFEIEDTPMPGSDRPRHRAWLPRSVPEVRGNLPMGALLQDLKFAARSLMARPAFAGIVITMLALGIGANTAMFSWINGMLLKPLRVEAPERWVQLTIVRPGGFRSSYSYPNFLDHRERNRVFDHMYAYRMAPVSVSFGSENQRSTAGVVSAGFFTALSPEPAAGRAFTEAEDSVPGRDAVAVISHGFWQRNFAGDPSVVGRAFQLNAHPFTIVGVMPEGFGFARIEANVDFWVPLAMQEIARPGSGTLESRGSGFLAAYGRLGPGVSLQQGHEGLNTMHAALAEEFPDALEGTTVSLEPATRSYLGPNSRAVAAVFTVLMGVVGSVLLIACANVANLMLARGADRQREIGIRLALGAGRRRVVRQLLAESLILASVAGVAGVLLAVWISRAVASFQPPLGVPVSFDMPIDLQVMAFTIIVALATGLLFGLLPALRVSRPELVATLKGGGRMSTGNRLRNALVATQVAMSLALLIGAALFLRSLQNANAIDAGFEADNVLVATLDPGLQGYSDDEVQAFYRQLVEYTEHVPGVDAVALAEMLPMSLGTQQWGASIEGYEPAPDERMNLDYNYVSPGYFEALGVPLVAGRDFTWDDTAASAGAIIINETMSERFFPGESALGRNIQSGGMDRQIVGVARDSKYYSLGENPLSYMYFPFMQSNQSALSLHVRSDSETSNLVDAVRGEVGRLDAELPIFDVRTMQAQLGIALLPARMTAGLLGVFGFFALLLAGVGLYGVMAYAVGQRTREIGIRMALGASGNDLIRMILRQTTVLLAIGLGIGLLAGAGVGRAAESLLYGVAWADATAFGGAIVVIVIAVLLASFMPARRATRVDPVDALRVE